MFRSKPKSEVHQYRDGRIKLSGRAYQQMRQMLCDLAGSHCERCGRFVGMVSGEAHHKNGRGGGKRDDRVFVDGVRQLEWLCRFCHHGQHNPKAVLPKDTRVLSDDELKSLLGL